VKLKSLSTLQLALGASLAVHAALVTVRFVDPQGLQRVFQDTPLEIILVNAKTQEHPEQPQAIAQAALAGGGEAARGRTSSPLPTSALSTLGNAAEDAQRQIDALQEQQTLLLAQLKRQLASLPPPVPRQFAANTQAQPSEEKRRQLVKLLAEIEKRIQEENARPKKRYLSPATSEAVYALYYDEMRHRIEQKGTQNFPQLAGNKLYGELTMVVTVNFDGRVLETEVVQSSGNIALDKRAQAIARSAGPFGRFNDAMRQRADQIVVVSRFKFSRDEVLQTILTNP
jgi:periplasmic protein TonB